MDIEKAIQFIKKNGNEIEQARLNYVLSNDRASEEITAKLFAGQRADGGWSPFWAENYSSLDATCFRLAQAEQLGIRQSEFPVMRAMNFLSQRQSSDGCWEEEMEVVESAPPWAKPGEISARLYLTANCGLWLAGGLFHKLNQQASSRIFEYLSSRINDLATSNLSWLITTMCAAGVTPKHSLLEKAASLLEQSQKDNGCWESEDGSSQEVHATLEAIRALSLCGRVVK